MKAEIRRCKPLNSSVAAPASKSYTHRAFIAAALADGSSIIHNPLYASDTEITLKALQELGVVIWRDNKTDVRISGTGGSLKSPAIPVDIGDSGTSMRLLTPVCLFADKSVALTGSSRMQERPIGPLVQALNRLGAEIEYTDKNGYPPLLIKGGLSGGETEIDGTISSQFVSALLMSSVYARNDTLIRVQNKAASAPYINITLDVMQKFGISASRSGVQEFMVKAGQKYVACDYHVEGDFSAASYFFAAAAICGGTVTVTNLNPVSVQGDRKFPELLKRMGCEVTAGRNSVKVERFGTLKGINVNMSDCPDVVQTLSVVAAVAEGSSRIEGVKNLRYKESDRIQAIADGLTALGCRVELTEDSITVIPAKLHGGIINPKNDHRTAMSFALLGLFTGDMVIENAECVSKSFPEFWEIMEELCGHITLF